MGMSKLQIILNLLVIAYIIVKERVLVLKALSASVACIAIGAIAIAKGVKFTVLFTAKLISSVHKKVQGMVRKYKELQRERRITRFINEFSKEEVLEMYDDGIVHMNEEECQKAYDVAQGRIRTEQEIAYAEVAAAVEEEPVAVKELTYMALIVEGKIFSYTDKFTKETIDAVMLKDKDGYDFKFSDFNGDDSFMHNVDFLMGLNPTHLSYDHKDQWAVAFHNANRKRSLNGLNKISIDDAEVIMLTIKSTDIQYYKVFELKVEIDPDCPVPDGELITEEDVALYKETKELSEKIEEAIKRTDELSDRVSAKFESFAMQVDSMLVDQIISSATKYESPITLDDAKSNGFCSKEDWERLLGTEDEVACDIDAIAQKIKESNRYDMDTPGVVALIGGAK